MGTGTLRLLVLVLVAALLLPAAACEFDSHCANAQHECCIKSHHGGAPAEQPTAKTSSPDFNVLPEGISSASRLFAAPLDPDGPLLLTALSPPDKQSLLSTFRI